MSERITVRPVRVTVYEPPNSIWLRVDLTRTTTRVAESVLLDSIVRPRGGDPDSCRFYWEDDGWVNILWRDQDTPQPE